MQRLATAKQFLTCKDTAERTDSRWIQAKNRRSLDPERAGARRRSYGIAWADRIERRAAIS
jgi:hypothetical protein